MLKDKKLWVNIPDFVGYQVSNDGCVRSFRTGNNQKFRGPKTLKSATNTTGHKWVKLHSGKGIKTKIINVHRIMMKSFNPTHNEDNLIVCHLNGIPDDNRLDNLVWGTNVLNAEHSRIHGTLYRGEKHHRAKITNKQAIEIKKLIFGSSLNNKQISEKYPISQSLVSKIRNGKC